MKKKGVLIRIVILLSLFFILFIGAGIFKRVQAAESYECTNVSNITGGVLIQTSEEIQKGAVPACTSIDTGELGFKIPSLGGILTFIVRAFFAIAGLAALLYLLLGAFAWITSGGDKDAVGAAQQKIQAAVIGVILIVGVLSIIWTLEQIIFNRRICLGLSCPLTLPGLVEQSGTNTQQVQIGVSVAEVPSTHSSTDDAFCCVCIKDDGTFGDRINTQFFKCGDNGVGEAF